MFMIFSSLLNPTTTGLFRGFFVIYQQNYDTVHFRRLCALHKVCEGHTDIYDESLGIGGVWGIGEGDFLRFHFSHFQISRV